MQHPAGEDAGREMSMRKVAFASFIGTAIEFYDFYIYGTAAALVLSGAFFPEFSETAGTLAAYRHVRRRLRGAYPGRYRLRTLRGPHRTQGHAYRLAPGHGHRDVLHRAPPRLRDDRRGGAAAAGVVALRSGGGVGRRVGRRRPDGHRTRPAGQAGLLFQLSADGAGGGVLALQRPFFVVDVVAAGEAVRPLGVADPLFAEHGAGRDRALRPGDDRRDAGPHLSRSRPPSDIWCNVCDALATQDCD